MPLFKKTLYLIEALICLIFIAFSYLLPIKVYSYCFGKLLRALGPFLKANSVADKNLKACLPHLTKAERVQISKDMWQHFGNIIGELPYWHRMSSKEFRRHVEIENHYKPSKNHGSFFVSGHFGNFELTSRISRQEKLNLKLLYRSANNPYVDSIINYFRKKAGAILIAKSRLGVRAILQVIQNHGHIGILVDQRNSEGITTTFFGRECKTSSLPAKIVLKTGAKIVMAKMVKVGPVKYKVTIFKPMEISATDTEESITQKINDILEDWIRQNPSQWFWMHNRFKL
jgi:KDO2-lipid IV(A) lauroyltransferase